MGIFANGSNVTGIADGELIIEDSQAYEEACAAALLARQPDEVINEFAHSPECEALITEGKISRKTIMKLNKNDDLSRRTKIAAYQLAKEHNDPLWTKLVKNRVKERELISAIMAKYGGRGEQVAKKSQRSFLSNHGPSASVKAGIDKSREKELNNGRAGKF